MASMKTAAIFRRRGVRFAYLFGSRACGRERPDSDYDFAVSLTPARAADDSTTALWLDLVRALRTDHVDLVLLEEADLTLREVVARTGRLIYERDRDARIRFECRTRKEAWDEAPHWAVHDAALVRRLREGTFGR
jgi:predicted nucleotidyltransferase